LKENWYAFYLCIRKEMSIDKALTKMAVAFKGHCRQMNPRPSKYSEKDVENILSLKDKGKSYKEIGEIIGMTTAQAAGVVRMYKQKATRTPTKVVQVAL